MEKYKISRLLISTTLLLVIVACGGSATKDTSKRSENRENNVSENRKEPTISSSRNSRLNGTEKPWDHGKLKVSTDKRMLQHEDGTSFFYLADTAWFMHMRMNREDMSRYFKDRAQKGFTVVQTNIMSLVWGENAYGDRAYPVEWQDNLKDENGVEIPNSADNSEAFKIDQFITTPGNNPNDAQEYDFWDHVDYAIDEAAKNGLYIAMVVTWGGHVRDFIKEDETLYRNYATWLAKRYKDKPNIIWLNGGDVYDETLQQFKQWDWIGEALRKEDHNHLISYHGAPSSRFHGNKDWLDFNMVESGHGVDLAEQNSWIIKDYAKTSFKPVMDGEGRYEEMDTGSGHRITSFETRELAYYQLFSGAFGHAYGHNSVWQVSSQEDVDAGDPGADAGYGHRIFPLRTWEEALDAPAAIEMSYLSKLMQSRPILGRVPDNSLIASGEGVATRGEGYAFVYSSKGEALTINLGKISGSKINIWSYNPRTGVAKSLKTNILNSGTYTFNPDDTKDWVVVLDDVSKKYKF